MARIILEKTILKNARVRFILELLSVFIVGLVVGIVFLRPTKTTNGPPGYTPTPSGQYCIQVITQAFNPQTGDVVDFPTPCDVPKGWEVAPAGCHYEKVVCVIAPCKPVLICPTP
ncbi:MAG: hypothetical protein A2750_00585 [Candidatus Yanofskybacteria bacterium RIFCSPHIGHO2_01_FULL_45_42]|uniref:Uncharacterized protein n=3 Tax=Candidatus Yanofskyibacteriota TaxID=1752733 RepID=A0A1F8H5T5_9BACT|nr:MAG: hypothetical protein A2750_00585 [Candidatus Yanofskybacteria bacterium RIFCSPHIGHO2_01_FULL_45_42]OGN16381.1 MAG: hypothetical protein A3C81_02905 [Candidatus Yanofskybacteria bacterium RIFCSPHIGHO2_02_FULL_46_19]OGN27054.1 MAG: hypothetical protein A3B17_02395 [Candidatus Yanofskybacteria bacterium RIFCSPLOWO2_01_FULL_45_72]OGN32368.1 MAG: hypothetical protein A3J01_00375 [Candidatus Yanofskybacteria bacterium RIFCSPLOWO2_02_FULL_45_18]